VRLSTATRWRSTMFLGEKLSNQGLSVGESQEPSDQSTSERVGEVKERGAYPTLLLVGALTVDLDP
jgi:hypothetical protein